MRDEHRAMIAAMRGCQRERLNTLIREHMPRAKKLYLSAREERMARMAHHGRYTKVRRVESV